MPADSGFKLERRRFGSLHISYLVLAGAAGWAVLIAASPQGLEQTLLGSKTALTFLALGLTAQLLSFNAGANLQVSLDAAFYVAAIVILGPVETAWLVSVAMAVDTARKFAARTRGRPGDPKRPLRHELASLLYNSGTGALSVLAAYFLVPHPDCSTRTNWLLDPWALVTTLPELMLAFVSVNYAFAVGSLWTQGRKNLGRTIYRVVLPSIGTEFVLVPLSVVLVALYKEANLFLFVVMAITFLSFNLVVKLLVETREQLKQRVSELKSLNAVGRAVGASLQLDQVLDTVVNETLKLVPNASMVALALEALPSREGREQAEEFDVLVLEKGSGSPVKARTTGDSGLLGYVASRKEPLLLRDAGLQGARFGREMLAPMEGIKAFAGVPMLLGSDCIGVVAVASDQPGQFVENTVKLLESIATEAAVAVQNARLFEMATEDGLTGLYVRRYFEQRLEEEWHRARRYGSRFSVIISDLDDFKEVNDTYGHQVGDQVLKEFSERIVESMRANDIPARYGGEEFTMLLPRANTKDAVRVAERLRVAVAAMRVDHGGHKISITASFGIAAFPECGMDDTTRDVFRKADAALYKAKRDGKNRVEVWTEELDLDLSARPFIERGMEQGYKNRL